MRTVRDLYDLTLQNGGGTFSQYTHNDVDYGYAVGMVRKSLRVVNVRDYAGFARAIRAVKRFSTKAYIGTWVDGDTIHVDPVAVACCEYEAAIEAAERNQLAYYIIHEQREVRL